MGPSRTHLPIDRHGTLEADLILLFTGAPTQIAQCEKLHKMHKKLRWGAKKETQPRIPGLNSHLVCQPNVG